MIDEAAAGETVIITRHGKLAAEIKPPALRLGEADAARLIDEIAARAKLRPSLGESSVDIIRKMRDGED